jgi:hypothetical protein
MITCGDRRCAYEENAPENDAYHINQPKIAAQIREPHGLTHQSRKYASR